MTQLNQLIAQYKLKPNHVYLLELIPLIQMIWADGTSQEAEIAILQQYTMKHLSLLGVNNEGDLPISVEETNAFIDHFLKEKPPTQLLDDLSRLCVSRLKEHSDKVYSQARADEIIDFCIDIAAACASQYPYDFNERVVDQEKVLLKDLITRLRSSK